MPMTEQEEIEFIDRILADIKEKDRQFIETVQVGDTIFADYTEDKIYTFSRFKYCTAMKGYKVLSIENGSVKCESDIAGHYQSLTSHRIMRDGKVIWDSRSIVEWRYKGKDYKGYWVTYHCPDDLVKDDPDYERTELEIVLVQLITPTKKGKEHDLFAIRNDECESMKINGEPTKVIPKRD